MYALIVERDLVSVRRPRGPPAVLAEAKQANSIGPDDGGVVAFSAAFFSGVREGDLPTIWRPAEICH